MDAFEEWESHNQTKHKDRASLGMTFKVFTPHGQPQNEKAQHTCSLALLDLRPYGCAWLFFWLTPDSSWFLVHFGLSVSFWECWIWTQHLIKTLKHKKHNTLLSAAPSVTNFVLFIFLKCQNSFPATCNISVKKQELRTSRLAEWFPNACLGKVNNMFC